MKQAGTIKESTQAEATTTGKRWVEPQILTLGKKELATHIEAAALSKICNGVGR